MIQEYSYSTLEQIRSAKEEKALHNSAMCREYRDPCMHCGESEIDWQPYEMGLIVFCSWCGSATGERETIEAAISLWSGNERKK